jgi:hypothetical protein
VEWLAAGNSPGPATTLAEALAGAAAGLLLGALAWPAIAQSPGRAWPNLEVGELIVIGAFVGWPAVCGIACCAAMIDLAAGALARFFWPSLARIGWATWLAIATTLWLAFWAAIVSRMPILGQGNLGLVVAAGALTATAALGSFGLRRGQ